ncbi:MauE/DoxX family redox-associated membrane protein [Streptacidiphilus cavernicola]|uniref:MauE/DoxX family redox-associated membrane protein n=1 Tax=Streptacidiphilus cavernicola TaxID=3342716 RepID=A0ABV6VW15_9ACTN
MRWTVLVCDLLVVGVFALSAASKLRGRRAFAGFVRSLEPLVGLRGRSATAIAAVVVLLECAVVPLSLLPGAGRTGPGLAVLLLCGFTAVLASALRRGSTAPCACFGASVSPASGWHIVRNVLLLASSVLAALPSDEPAALWRAPAPALLLCLLTAVVLVVALTRLDDLAELLRPAAATPVPDTVDARPGEPAAHPRSWSRPV